MSCHRTLLKTECTGLSGLNVRWQLKYRTASVFPNSGAPWRKSDAPVNEQTIHIVMLCIMGAELFSLSKNIQPNLSQVICLKVCKLQHVALWYYIEASSRCGRRNVKGEQLLHRSFIRERNCAQQFIGFYCIKVRWLKPMKKSFFIVTFERGYHNSRLRIWKASDVERPESVVRVPL